MLSKPKDSDEVYEVMKSYCLKKQYKFSDAKLKFMSEDFFLFWEGRQWDKVKYWPAVAMRWVLTFVSKQEPKTKHYNIKKPVGKTVRQKLLEQENNECGR